MALVEGLARGEVRPALETFAAAGAIHETAGHKAAVREAVDRWMKPEGVPRPGDALLIARTNAGRLALDAEVRGRLRQLETLRGSDVAIDAVTPSGKPYELKLAVGDRIRFGMRADIGDGVINGTTGEVRAWARTMVRKRVYAQLRAEIDLLADMAEGLFNEVDALFRRLEAGLAPSLRCCGYDRVSTAR